jgi:hypothetical protein
MEVALGLKKTLALRGNGYVKMIVVDDLTEHTINAHAEERLNHNVVAVTDDWRGYGGLQKAIAAVKQQVTPPKESMDKLPWVHTVISNAKK